MITLCGFAVSNYFNVVKQVLLEKQIPYTEERTMTRSKDEAVLSASPERSCDSCRLWLP